MRLPKDIPIYGDREFRGECPSEQSEQVAFFLWLRHQHPNLASVATHPRNEGRRSSSRARQHKLMGMTPGASDVIIPCSPAIVIEMKRADHTKSSLQSNQLTYLRAAQQLGSFVGIALGADGAREAIEQYLHQRRPPCE